MERRDHNMSAHYLAGVGDISEAMETHDPSIASDADELAGDFASAPSETSAMTPQTTFGHRTTAEIPALAGTITASPFDMEPTGIFDTPQVLHFNAGWHSSSHSSVNTSEESVGMAAHPPLNPFDFQHSYGREPQGSPPEDQAMMFGNTYLEPSMPVPPLRLPYVWDMMNTANLQSEVANLQQFGPGGLANSSSTCVVATAASAGQDFLGSRPYPAEQQSSGASAYSVDSSVHEEVQQPKRAKTASHKAVAKSPIGSTSPNRRAAVSPLSHPTIAGSSKDSSSARSMVVSKPHHPLARPLKKAKAGRAEVAEEGKARSSHNVVEKQYRNRLNAQFEGLINALPDNLKSQGSVSIDNSDILNPDVAERRISKAEVLDMARRHIQTLEQERDLLAHERARLQETVERLKDNYARGEQGSQDRMQDN